MSSGAYYESRPSADPDAAAAAATVTMTTMDLLTLSENELLNGEEGIDDHVFLSDCDDDEDDEDGDDDVFDDDDDDAEGAMPLLGSHKREPSRYSSKYSRANEVDGGRLMQLGSGGEAADDASIPAAIHKHSKSKNNHHMLPNGDGGRTPIRIPVPPVTRGGKNWSSSSRGMNNDPESQQIKPEDGNDGGASRRGSGRRKRYPREVKKTLAAAVFTTLNFLLTAVSLAYVHEIHPEGTEPLPDQFLDRITYQAWALYGSEILLSVQTVSAVLVIIFHRHRWIVLRRVFLIIGLLYMYRAVTMWVTALPKADKNYECAEKFGGPLTFAELFKRVVKIVTGFGLSINGNHIYCGDYVYSGHSMILILGHLVTKQYTPSSFFVLHWLTFFNALTGIVLLLLSRGHYTLDVIIAYFVATRMWALYHTLAGHEFLKRRSVANLVSQFWWFRGFLWMEESIKAGPLPNEFTWPVASLGVLKDRAVAAIFASKYTSVVAMKVERGMDKMGRAAAAAAKRKRTNRE